MSGIGKDKKRRRERVSERAKGRKRDRERCRRVSEWERKTVEKGEGE